MEHSELISHTVNLPEYPNEKIELITAGNNEAGKAIVFIHGATLTYQLMTIFMPYFNNYQLIFVNAPGRGNSTPVERNKDDLTTYTKRINSALIQAKDKLNLKDITLVGYSMGGVISTKILSYNSLPISHVVYLNSAGRVDMEKSAVARIVSKIRAGQLSEDDPNTLEAFPEFGFGSKTPKEFIESIDFVQFQASFESSMTDILYTAGTDYLADLSEVQNFPKALFLLGEDDQIIPNSDSKTTQARFEELGVHTKMITYPGVGHLDFPRIVEKPSDDNHDSLVHYIQDWLND